MVIISTISLENFPGLRFDPVLFHHGLAFLLQILFAVVFVVELQVTEGFSIAKVNHLSLSGRTLLTIHVG